MKNAHHRYVIVNYSESEEVFTSNDLQDIRNKLNERAIQEHIQKLSVNDTLSGNCERADKIAAGGQF